MNEFPQLLQLLGSVNTCERISCTKSQFLKGSRNVCTKQNWKRSKAHILKLTWTPDVHKCQSVLTRCV